MAAKRIIFEQSDSDYLSCKSHMDEQMEIRRQIFYKQVKTGGQGFLSAMSFIAPLIIVGAIFLIYTLFK